MSSVAANESPSQTESSEHSERNHSLVAQLRYQIKTLEKQNDSLKRTLSNTRYVRSQAQRVPHIEAELKRLREACEMQKAALVNIAEGSGTRTEAEFVLAMTSTDVDG